MRNASIDELAVEAQWIRSAIERAQLSRFIGIMSRFPRGCCKVTSQLLGRHLVQTCEIGPIEFVGNARRAACDGHPFQTHFWLEHRDVIIDVTADQFSNAPGRIIVTNDRSWHDTFSGRTRHDYQSSMRFNPDFPRKFDQAFCALQEVPA